MRGRGIVVVVREMAGDDGRWMDELVVPKVLLPRRADKRGHA
jgi:hypothetical protein